MPSLDSFVSAIHTAVLQATDIAEAHELESIQREQFWYQEVKKDGTLVTDEEGNPVYRPRMMTMRIPVWEEGKLVEQDIKIPMQSLTTGQSLRISELSVEMEVELQGLDDSEKTQVMINTNVGGSLLKKTNKAKLQITFKGQEPPEGYARIDNQLIKLLP